MPGVDTDMGHLLYNDIVWVMSGSGFGIGLLGKNCFFAAPKLYLIQPLMSNKHGQFILCVDDDEDDHFFLKSAIREVDPDMQTMEFHNGAQALKFLKEAKKEHELPCVMVLDINMPVMDGKETLKRIKADEELSHVQVVVLTTSALPSDKEYFASLGVEMYTKPVSAQGLKQIAELFVQHCK